MEKKESLSLSLSLVFLQFSLYTWWVALSANDEPIEVLLVLVGVGGWGRVTGTGSLLERPLHDRTWPTPLAGGLHAGPLTAWSEATDVRSNLQQRRSRFL